MDFGATATLEIMPMAQEPELAPDWRDALVERRGRTGAEADLVIRWLTGCGQPGLRQQIDRGERP